MTPETLLADPWTLVAGLLVMFIVEGLKRFTILKELVRKSPAPKRAPKAKPKAKPRPAAKARKPAGKKTGKPARKR